MRCAPPVHAALPDGSWSMLQRVVVTRPEPEASRWAKDLQQAGWPSVALPLMAFSEPSDSSSLRSSLECLGTYQASMWVSPQAVQAFAPVGFAPELFLASEQMGLSHRFWAPGPGTARALRAAGVPNAQIDQPAADAPQFDSDALWAQVAGQVSVGFRLLLVHGEGQEEGVARPSLGADQTILPARERLAQRVRAAGGEVDGCVAYQRGCPTWSEPEHALAQQLLEEGALWLFSSSEAVAHLVRLMPHARWSRSEALTTHPRIAQTATDFGFGCVKTCRPALADVHAALRNRVTPA